MYAFLWALGTFVAQDRWPWFLASVIIGVVIYFGMTGFFGRVMDYKVFKDIKAIFGALR